AAWLISRVFTVRSAAGGLLETRAGPHSGCKMQTAFICAGRCTPRAITDDGSGWRPHFSSRGEPLSSNEGRSTHVDRVARATDVGGVDVHWQRRNLDTPCGRTLVLAGCGAPPGCGS